MNFDGLVVAEKVSLPRLKSWILAATGLPLWLLTESQRFAGSLNEALALVLGPPEGKIAEKELAEGLERWREWDELQKQAWTIQVLLLMEVPDRRSFMALLNGRTATKPVGLSEAVETISLQVDAILLYVRPLGRGIAQYELTFGLRVDEIVDGGLEEEKLLSDSQYIGCLKAMVGDDGAGGGLQGVSWEGALTQWISENLGERIGPIRGVRVSEVFSLHCKGVEFSKRHKAGFKAASVRMLAWHSEGASVTPLSAVRDLLPKPQDSGQSG